MRLFSGLLAPVCMTMYGEPYRQMRVDQDVIASVIEIRFDTATTICDEVDKAEKDKMTSVNKKKVSQALAVAGTLAQVQTPAHTPTHAHYTLHVMPSRRGALTLTLQTDLAANIVSDILKEPALQTKLNLQPAYDDAGNVTVMRVDPAKPVAACDVMAITIDGFVSDAIAANKYPLVIRERHWRQAIALLDYSAEATRLLEGGNAAASGTTASGDAPATTTRPMLHQVEVYVYAVNMHTPKHHLTPSLVNMHARLLACGLRGQEFCDSAHMGGERRKLPRVRRREVERAFPAAVANKIPAVRQAAAVDEGRIERRRRRVCYDWERWRLRRL
jgi:hypothetical protein